MVTFLGAGPGAVDLITLRGKELLEKAEIIIYAGSLVNPELLNYAPKGCRIYDSAGMTLDDIIEVIKEGDRENKNIVRLHTGDPALYGAIREQMDILDENGISYEYCPGVSSLFGAASALKKEFTVPDGSQSLIITRKEGRTPVPERESIKSFAAHGSSMAIFLSVGMAAEVSKELIDGGYDPDTPASIVYKATWDDEKVVHTTVKDLPVTAEENGIKRTAIIFVGSFLDEKGRKSKLYDPEFSTGYRKSGKRIAIASFTDKGDKLNKRLTEIFTDSGDYVVNSRLRGEKGISLHEWTYHNFTGYALIFIGASGIAVRSIAPFIESKDRDPAVIVIDELGKNVIPILSGHLGGANSLAEEIASILEGEAKVTTATDLNGILAIDNWAAEQGYSIDNINRIKSVSGALLSGERVGVSISPYLSRVFPETLNLVPKCLCLGIGCRKGTDPAVLREHVEELFRKNNLSISAVSDIATIDIKRGEEAIESLGREFGSEVSFFTSAELNDIPDRFSFEGSDFVEAHTGCDNVCERSAVKRALQLAGEDKVKLLIKKSKGDGVTAAVAIYDAFDAEKSASENTDAGKKIYVVGIGPGKNSAMTGDAEKAIRESRVITGYRVYLDLIKDHLISDKEIIVSGMKEEKKRCEIAREKALKGLTTAVICSGDAGVYGMAGLLMEVCKDYPDIDIEVVPGITAAISGGALLGAPLMNDFVSISLSDLMTPWDTIEKRIRHAALGDFVIVFYNPGSHNRKDYLPRALSIILETRPEDTVCGYVKNIGREGEEMKVCSLNELTEFSPDMFTTVFIGNSMTKIINGRMVTLRGYENGNDIKA